VGDGCVSVALLDRFDAQMRWDPPAGPGVRIERADPVVRERGSHNLIAAWDFGAAETESVVAREAAFFRALAEDVEWKVYAHDRPENLAVVLAAHGFEPEERETVMVLKLGDFDDASPANGDVEVRMVRTPADLDAYVAVTARAFGSAPKSTAETLAARTTGEAAETIAALAFVAGDPVAAGRLELPPGRAFASLWGGGTDPAYRGRGVYRRLVVERIRWARARGYGYVTVDAQETSRPILERIGFIALTTVQGWVLAGRE